MVMVATTGAAVAGCGSTGLPVGAQEQSVAIVAGSTASAQHPVMWFWDRTDDHVLVAYNWDGEEVGTVRLSYARSFGALQSPDGAALVLGQARPVSGARVVGRATGKVSWARDSTHLCSFRQPSGADLVAQGNGTSGTVRPGALFVEDPASGSSRRVTLFGRYGGEAGLTILSCSLPDDRAVVGETVGGGPPSHLAVVTLSSGAQVPFAPRPPGPVGGPQGIVASPDAKLVAEGSTGETWASGFDSVTNQFTIYDSSTGAALATIPNGIVTFSDNDSRVLTVQYLGNSNQEGIYRLVDWRDGAVLWSAKLPHAGVLTRPGSGDVLLEPTTSWGPVPGTQGARQPFSIPIIVRADGATLQLPEVRPLPML